MKVGLAQWTGFDAAPDTLDVAKLGDDAKKLGARYPWVLKEHKRLEAAAREAAEKKRKRLEAAAMEAAAHGKQTRWKQPHGKQMRPPMRLFPRRRPGRKRLFPQPRFKGIRARRYRRRPRLQSRAMRRTPP